MLKILENVKKLPIELQIHIASMDFETFLILYKKNFDVKCLVYYYCKFFKLEKIKFESLIHFYKYVYLQDFALYTSEDNFIYRPYLKILILSSNLFSNDLYLLSPNLENIKIRKVITLDEKWLFPKVLNLYLKCKDLSHVSKIFPKLKVLTCMDNTISTLPYSLKNLQLISLTLSNCNLEYFPHINIDTLENLDLSWNNLSFFSGKYKNLKNLNLSSNSITSIDISNCKKLSTVNVQSNFLSFLDIENFSLKYLDASMNNIYDIYLSTPELTTLNLSCNEISKISFDNVKSFILKKLDVSGNIINSIEDMRFSILKHLDISNNDISYIEDLPSTLTVLNLEYNPLYYIYDKCFDNVKFVSADHSLYYLLNGLKYTCIDIVDDYIYEINAEMYD